MIIPGDFDTPRWKSGLLNHLAGNAGLLNHLAGNAGLLNHLAEDAVKPAASLNTMITHRIPNALKRKFKIKCKEKPMKYLDTKNKNLIGNTIICLDLKKQLLYGKRKLLVHILYSGIERMFLAEHAITCLRLKILLKFGR